MQYTCVEVVNGFRHMHFSYMDIASFVVEFYILDIDGLICILYIDGLHLYIVILQSLRPRIGVPVYFYHKW